MPKKKSATAQKRAVDEWNKMIPVGTAVIVRHDPLRGDFATKTRSVAWMLGEGSLSIGHTAVVRVAGIPGAYLLSRVRVARQAGNAAAV